MIPPHLEQAIHQYLPTMEGWTTPERGCEMAAAILETKPEVCVEIGVYACRSLLCQAFALRHLGRGMVYGVDPWSVDAAVEGDAVEENARWWREDSHLEEMHRRTMKAIWDHRLEEWATVIRAPSQYVSHLFPIIDFLNIDGAHSELVSCRDVSLYLPRVRSGAYVFFDDSDWGSTQKALSLVEAQCDLVSDTGKARSYRKR